MFDCVVFDQKVNAPVEGAMVLVSVQRASGGFNPNWEEIASTTTNASGQFSIDIEKEVFYAYRFEISHPQHFYTEFEVSPDDVPISSAYERTFAVEPRSWVSLHLMNDEVSQAITMSTNGNSDDCTECCNGTNHFIPGWPIDTVLTCLMYGGEDATISGNYADMNGGVHIIAQNVTTVPFDTVEVEIIY